MSNSIDHGYTVVRDAEAFVQRLTGDKLLKAQERLAFGLVRRNSLLPWIEPQSGIGPRHFPASLQPLMVIARTKTREEILQIVTAQPGGTVAHAYRKGIELSPGEALQLAKQIVLGLVRNQESVSEKLGGPSDPTPGVVAPQKTVPDKIAPSARRVDKQDPPNIKYGLFTVCAADVTPKRVDAIWADDKGGVRLARGEHTVFAGEPGLGKSQVAIAMAAAVSTGGDWPCGDGRAPLGGVIILAAEDSIEHTLVPRLMAAGADLSRIHFVQAVATEDGKGRRTFNFQSDFAKLEKLVKATQHVVLVIIDPVTAYLGKIDSHKNTEVRGVLVPIGELARECNIAIASVTHFTKGGGSASTKALDRIIGSIAFIAAPRIGLTVVEDPEDKDRRLLLHVKNNISRRPVGLAFRLEQRIVASDATGGLPGSCVAWETTPVEKTADEVLGIKGNKEVTAKTERMEFLKEVLAAGPQKVADIETEAREAGLLGKDQAIGQSKPFRAAREALGIKPYQAKGQKRAGWFWPLPEHQVPPDQSDALQKNGASDGKEGT